MVTKQTNSNFTKGVVQIQPSIDKDDRRNGIDGWLDGNIPIAFRKRPNLTIDRYEGRIVTIRIAKPIFQGYIPFEYDKLLNGQFRALLYFFKLKEHLIICPTQAIINYLKEYAIQDLDIHPNVSGDTDLIGIHPNELESTIILPLNLPFILKEE